MFLGFILFLRGGYFLCRDEPLKDFEKGNNLLRSVLQKGICFRIGKRDSSQTISVFHRRKTWTLRVPNLGKVDIVITFRLHQFMKSRIGVFEDMTSLWCRSVRTGQADLPFCTLQSQLSVVPFSEHTFKQLKYLTTILSKEEGKTKIDVIVKRLVIILLLKQVQRNKIFGCSGHIHCLGVHPLFYQISFLL